MTQLDPKYVSSPHAVNRRTAMKQARQAPPVNPLVRERLQATKARSKLGTPLLDLLRVNAASHRRVPPSPATVVGAVVAAGSAVALVLAAIQHTWPLALGAAVGVVAGGAMLLYGRRGSVATLATLQPAVTILDEASLRAFDRALEEVALEVPDEVATELMAIKQVIVRVARQAGSSGINEHFTMEDRMYLTECVRRYLPDSLQSYLRVPRDQRVAPVLEQGQSASGMLSSQLALLKRELDKQEIKLTRSVAEHLVTQHRFLAAKARP